MNPLANEFSARALTRRQFGLLLGGGAVLLVAGGTYGVIAASDGVAQLSLATPFGKVNVLRVGRFGRLNGRGHAAMGSLGLAASHISRGNAQGVAVPVGGRLRAVESHGHHGQIGEPRWPQPLNLTWGDVVVLEMELQNDGGKQVLFSPGQMRLRLNHSDVTVTPQDSDRPPGSLAGYAREVALISYLAPHAEALLELEFTDDHHEPPRRLQIPLPATTELLS